MSELSKKSFYNLYLTDCNDACRVIRFVSRFFFLIGILFSVLAIIDGNNNMPTGMDEWTYLFLQPLLFLVFALMLLKLKSSFAAWALFTISLWFVLMFIFIGILSSKSGKALATDIGLTVCSAICLFLASKAIFATKFIKKHKELSHV